MDILRILGFINFIVLLYELLQYMDRKILIECQDIEFVNINLGYFIMIQRSIIFVRVNVDLIKFFYNLLGKSYIVYVSNLFCYLRGQDIFNNNL